MKIKQKRLVNLHELIKWAWENDKNKFFKSVNEEEVEVYICRGSVGTEAGNERPSADALFEIEEEVEIDENTVFENIVIINGFNNSYVLENLSINDRLESTQHENSNTKFIYLQNEDGSIGDLIWKNGSLVKEEG